MTPPDRSRRRFHQRESSRTAQWLGSNCNVADRETLARYVVGSPLTTQASNRTPGSPAAVGDHASWMDWPSNRTELSKIVGGEAFPNDTDPLGRSWEFKVSGFRFQVWGLHASDLPLLLSFEIGYVPSGSGCETIGTGTSPPTESSGKSISLFGASPVFHALRSLLPIQIRRKKKVSVRSQLQQLH